MRKSVSLAPMIDRTTKAFRHLVRLLSPNTEAVLHNEHPDKLLGYDITHEPVTLQLGGKDPLLLENAARKSLGLGFSRFNLNCGCPSTRVAEHGSFGALLMKDADATARIVEAMVRGTGGNPEAVSVKCRLGVLDKKSEGYVDVKNRARLENLMRFVDKVHSISGITNFVVHARIAVLDMDTKDNRRIPPLVYDDVYELKREYPSFHIVINGGIQTIEDVKEHLSNGMDGVMIGRKSWDDPCFLATLDANLSGSTDHLPKNRQHVIDMYRNFAENEMIKGTPPQFLVMPIQNLFQRREGGAKYRNELCQTRKFGFFACLESAVRQVTPEALNESLV